MKFSEAEIKAIADYKQLDSSKDITMSNTFRTTGRETNAPWTNRFRKDFNDLAYDVKYTLIKGKDQMKHPNRYQNRIRNSKRLVDQKLSSGRISSNSLDKSQVRVEMIKMNKKINPQKYDILESTRYSSINTQGLCKFQFEKTIGGKLMHRSSKHLKFEHQTERIINQNPIWFQQNVQGFNSPKKQKPRFFQLYSSQSILAEGITRQILQHRQRFKTYQRKKNKIDRPAKRSNRQKINETIFKPEPILQRMVSEEENNAKNQQPSNKQSKKIASIQQTSNLPRKRMLQMSAFAANDFNNFSPIPTI